MQYNKRMTNTNALAGSTMIEINSLNKSYNTQRVLKDLALNIGENEFCILVGANGAGKTTLLRILATLVRPESGEVLLKGEPLLNDPRLRQNIGYVSHQSLFYGDLNASENLRHYAHLYSLPNPEALIRECIERAGLTPHQNKPLRTYSRGMQQRLALERALMHSPDLILLDEPYTGLDHDAANDLDERLHNLHSSGCTLLVVAHRPQRLLKLATHIAWLREGRITDKVSTDRLSDIPDLKSYLQEVK
jgi:heme exporter protein A